MKNISFVKMSGAGNDFIMIDKTQNPEIALTSIVINRLCDRRNGIGADGIIIISDLDGYDFVMDYFNADGSTGTLCGNGARCAIKFAQSTGKIMRNTANFLSNKIEYNGELLKEDLIKFNLKPPNKIEEKIVVNAVGVKIPASYADTGSPHVVITLDDLQSSLPDDYKFNGELNKVPVIEIGREIRYDPAFAPGGANVNFIKIVNGRILIRSYERGVEDETLACGTGSVAAAIIANIKFNVQPPASIFTKGGEELNVNFKVEKNSFTDVSLTGPAKEIYRGEVIINNLVN